MNKNKTAFFFSLDGTNHIHFITELLPKQTNLLLLLLPPELQQTPTHLTHPLKLCILCEMSSNSRSLLFELLFMTRCVNYILFILSLCRFFFSFSPWVLQCRIIARPSYILCTKSAVPCPSPVRHNKVFPDEAPCSCFGGNWSLTVRRMVTQHADFSEGGAGTPTHPPPPTQSVGSAAHNGRGDRAGWDEDSFHKVPLRQRSLPSLRAIAPTVSHQEAGRFPRYSLTLMKAPV